MFAEFDRPSSAVKRVAIGQMRAKLRQLALREVGVEFVNVIGQHELQHGITEELQPLVVVIGAVALLVRQRRMRQSLRQ